MDGELAGRVAVVTGGTGALGSHVVGELLSRGARVHVPFRTADQARRLEEETGATGGGGGEGGGRLHLSQVDVTDEMQVADFFHETGSSEGRLDILCNVVGGFAHALLEDTDLSTWRRMQDLNATSCFLCCRAAVPLMRKNGWGRVVNVAALPALGRGAAGMSAYSASKAAVLNLTYSLAKELKAWGITVNAVVPGTIDTPQNRAAMPKADLSTFLDPARIARVIGFLVGEDAGIVTGSALALSAG
jgi:NAD(P)-dependent dehydrogenase (short-subunit alcohol dehydrogenase family)